MIIEIIVLEERLDASADYVKKLISEFFFKNRNVPNNIDIRPEVDGDKFIWAVYPEERSNGENEKLINGYIQINSVSLDRKSKPVDVRIVSCREELTLLW